MNDGGPAFPSQACDRLGNPIHDACYGLSLRDYMAAKALQGMAANPDWTDSNWESIALHAYECADAMLIAREEES